MFLFEHDLFGKPVPHPSGRSPRACFSGSCSSRCENQTTHGPGVGGGILVPARRGVNGKAEPGTSRKVRFRSNAVMSRRSTRLHFASESTPGLIQRHVRERPTNEHPSAAAYRRPALVVAATDQRHFSILAGSAEGYSDGMNSHCAARFLICSNLRTAGSPSRTIVACFRSLGSSIIVLATADRSFMVP